LLRILRKYKVGIYVTVIFHLCFIIALMGLKISTLSERIPSTIEIDFDNEKEEQQRKREETRSIERELAEEAYRLRRELAAEMASERLRNAAVNQETPKDNTKDNVLEENEAVQRRIANTYRMMRRQQSSDDAALPSVAKENTAAKAYTGPSVLSYFVKGRKAAYLPVPVYKCEAGGRVVVIITVTETGSVVDAQVDKRESSADECLLLSATEAAMRSKFNVMAGSRQQGSITYQFISQ
jgi:hypothetical protein